MAYKLDKVHAVKIGVITQYKTVQPLRAIPARLSAMAVFETLNKLGFSMPIHAASEVERSLRFGVAAAKSPLAIENQELSDALAALNLPISERIRFRFACERLGLLR
jgi:hypothetical protein